MSFRLYEISNVTKPKPQQPKRVVHLSRQGRAIHSLAPGQKVAVPDTGDWHLSCNEGAALAYIDERDGDEEGWMQRLEKDVAQPVSRLKAFKKEAVQ